MKKILFNQLPDFLTLSDLQLAELIRERRAGRKTDSAKTKKLVKSFVKTSSHEDVQTMINNLNESL